VTPRRPAAHDPQATLGRSVRLFSAFRAEPQDPQRYYQLLAADSAAQVGHYADLRGASVLDVGGGPGYFRSEFERRGATYRWVEPGLGEFSAVGRPGPGMVIASGEALPFRTGSVAVCYSSNVLEHVRRPWVMADEMVRVTQPGGITFCSFTLWWSPWGGHETSPWHLVGGDRAARRYERRTGRPPKNRYGESLFAVRAGEAVRWARSTRHAELVDVLPRYLPWWAHWTADVPGLREVVCWNLALVLRRC
jgi:SAM-dependent methyltransferase